MRNTLLTSGKLKELKEIQKARKDAGLAPLKMGFKNCLRCENEFYSEDLKNQHLCMYCREESTIQQVRKEK